MSYLPELYNPPGAGDDRLRALERAAQGGDPQAAMELHVERHRRGLPLLPDKVTRGSRRDKRERRNAEFVFPNNRIGHVHWRPNATGRVNQHGWPVAGILVTVNESAHDRMAHLGMRGSGWEVDVEDALRDEPWMDVTVQQHLVEILTDREWPRMNPPVERTVICAWCGKHLSGPPAKDTDQISHGICQPCHDEVRKQIPKKGNPGDASQIKADLSAAVRARRAATRYCDPSKKAQYAAYLAELKRLTKTEEALEKKLAKVIGQGPAEAYFNELERRDNPGDDDVQAAWREWQRVSIPLTPDLISRANMLRSGSGDPLSVYSEPERALAALMTARERRGLPPVPHSAETHGAMVFSLRHSKGWKKRKLTCEEAENVIVLWLQDHHWQRDPQARLIAQRGRGRGGHQHEVWVNKLPDPTQRITFGRRSVFWEVGGRGKWTKNYKVHPYGGELLTTDLAKKLLEGVAWTDALRENPATQVAPRTKTKVHSGHCMHKPPAYMPPWMATMCCRCFPKHIDHTRDAHVYNLPGTCDPRDPCDCDFCSGNQCPGCGLFYRFCRCGGRDPFKKENPARRRKAKKSGERGFVAGLALAAAGAAGKGFLANAAGVAFSALQKSAPVALAGMMNPPGAGDERLRALERAAASGDPQATEAYAAALDRVGGRAIPIPPPRPFARSPVEVRYFQGSINNPAGWYLISKAGVWSESVSDTAEDALRIAESVAEIRGDGSLSWKTGFGGGERRENPSGLFGVFPHAQQRVTTGRGFVVRGVDEHGRALDQHNYGGIQAVKVFKREASARALATKLTDTRRSNPSDSERRRRERDALHDPIQREAVIKDMERRGEVILLPTNAGERGYDVAVSLGFPYITDSDVNLTHPLFTAQEGSGRSTAVFTRHVPVAGALGGKEMPGILVGWDANENRWVILPEPGAQLRMPARPDPSLYQPWSITDLNGEWMVIHERTQAIRRLRGRSGLRTPGAIDRARDLARRLNQELSDDDVIYAFLNGMAAWGKKLTSIYAARDRTLRLDGNWMGGTGIAEWVTVGVNQLIQERDLGSKAAQSVQRRLRRMMRAHPLHPPRASNPGMLVMGAGSLAAAGLMNPPDGDLYDQAMGSPSIRRGRAGISRKSSKKRGNLSKKGPGERGRMGPGPKYTRKRITLEEASKHPGYEAALKAYREFHKAEPKFADAYTYDDGKPGNTVKVVVGLGHVPETHYVTDFQKTNKKGYHWIHHHPKGKEPLEVLDPATGTTSKIGGTYRVRDWWRQ